MAKAETDRVHRRRVFYIPGYDPIPPRRYRELYRREGTEQARISGYEIDLSPRKGDGFGWQVHSVQDGAVVQSEVEVLVWSDIVRESMRNTIAATWVQLLRTAWIYGSSGALWRLAGLRKGPVIAALYPVAMLVLQLALALAAGALAGRAIDAGLAWAGGDGAVVTLLPWAGAGFVAFALLRWFKARDGRIFAYYLMHDYAFTARHNGATPPELSARLEEFRARIAAALEEEHDEVLVVGHSSGAHLGVTILAGLLRGSPPRANGPALAFLTLGQVIPMVSFLPEANELRADLAFLSTRADLTWVDVTAPGDGCAFALCDPVAVSGVAPEGQIWPLVLSAAFTQTLSPERWKGLRWRFFRLHFQYLCAFDRPGDYDYFRITAGPLTLAARFRGRAPSKSRITRVASQHVSLAA